MKKIFVTNLLVFAFVALSVCSSRSMAADKYAFMVGGARELTDDSLDDSHRFNSFRDGLKERGWKDPEILFSKPSKVPTSKVASLDNLTKMLQHSLDVAKKDDTVVFYIDTEGLQEEGEGLPSIAINEEKLVNLSAFQATLEKLADRGVHVGLISQFCFSGRAQELAKLNPENICVVSSSGPNYVSVSSSDDNQSRFDNALAKISRFPLGTSLESAFRLARKNDIAPDMPTISSLPTPGLDILNEFLHRYDPMSYFRQKNLSVPGKSCPTCDSLDFIGYNKPIIDEALSVAEETLKINLKPQRDAMLNELEQYFNIYKAIQKPVLVLNPVLSQVGNWQFSNPTITAKYKHMKVGELMAVMEQLDRLKVKSGEDMSWLTADAKTEFSEFFPLLRELQQQLAPYYDAVQDQLKKYNAEKINLKMAASKFFIKERDYFEKFQDQYTLLKGNRKNQACENIRF